MGEAIITLIDKPHGILIRANTDADHNEQSSAQQLAIHLFQIGQSIIQSGGWNDSDRAVQCLSNNGVRWLAVGDRCHASNAMFTALTDVYACESAKVNLQHPEDAMGFARCRLLIGICPELASRANHLFSLSAEWRLIMNHWAEICRSMDAEAPNWFTCQVAMPITDKLIQNILSQQSKESS